MAIAAIVSVAALTLLLLFIRLGAMRTIIALLLVSLALLPIQVLGSSEQTFHVGIASPTPELRTFAVAIVVSTMILLAVGRIPDLRMYLPLIVWLLLNWAFVWEQSDLRLSGLIQYLVGLGAWAVAVTLGRDAKSGSFQRMIVYLVFAIVLANALVAVLQAAGLPINTLSTADSSILGSRVNGLSNHPNNLGKNLLLLSVLVLPFSESTDARVRKLAVASIAVSFLPLILAQGRTNLVALSILVLIWVIVNPILAVGRKAGILLGILVVALAASGVVIARFEEDPEGGVRGTIINFAYAVIHTYPVTGVGPNAYVYANSPLTGSYIPVHNSFLLAAAEIGIPGAVLLISPAIIVVIVAWMRRRDVSVGSYARAVVASAVPVALVGYTGWGMLGTSIFALAMAVYGFLWGSMQGPRPSKDLRARGVTAAQIRSLSRG